MLTDRIKDFIKDNMPYNIIRFYRVLRNRFLYKQLSSYDKRRFFSSAYDMKNDISYENLRAKLTFHYHSLEKGLSHIDTRFGFGQTAFSELFFALDVYLDKGYPLDDEGFQQSISVISAYIDFHKKNGYQIEEIEEKFSRYKKYLIPRNKDLGGTIEIKARDLPDYRDLSFAELVMNRHSIRDFGETVIPREDLIKSIALCSKTPSACNRQSSKVYIVNSSKLISEFEEKHRGLSTQGKNLQYILAVTFDQEYYNGAHERHQSFIDGALFAMTLTYALTHNNIASCTLNANFTKKRECELRRLIKVKNSEVFVCFIAIGSFPKNIKLAKSPRDMVEHLYEFLE